MENFEEQIRKNIALRKEMYEEKKRLEGKNDSYFLIGGILGAAILFSGTLALKYVYPFRNEIVRLSAYESESCSPYVEVYRGNEKILSSCGWSNELEEIVKKASQ